MPPSTHLPVELCTLRTLPPSPAPPLAGKMASRTRATVAGAIVSAVADLFLILVIGWDSFAPERRERHEHYTSEHCLQADVQPFPVEHGDMVT